MTSNVELYLGQEIFTGWISVSVRRSLEHLAGTFELGVMMPGQAVPDALTPGGALTLKINGQTVITGWLDQVRQSLRAGCLQITLSGRDKTGDLVDCSAIHAGSQWHNRTLAQIAADLCAPFGVAVRWQVNDETAEKAFASFTLETSETVADALSRAARHRGVLVTSNAEGDLVFTQAGETATDTLTLGENLLEADFTDDRRNRYSEYLVKGHGRGGGQSGNSATAVALAAPKGTITDSTVQRYRPKVILADQKIDAEGARQRAVREMRRAIARSVRFSATVRGWFRDNGSLWDVNLLTRVSAERVGVDKQALLICQVEFVLDQQSGEITRLLLAPRDGFIVPAEPDSRGSGGDDSGDIDAFIRRQMKKQGITFSDDE
ncbi:TPA: phage tail protein [Escherichia coli]|nr:phage tail protein [Escherichia coli]